MAYIPDMSEETYSKCGPYHFSVGWLDQSKEWTKGNVPVEFVVKLKLLKISPNPGHIYRGSHTCNLCDPEMCYENDPLGELVHKSRHRGNGEIHVLSSNGRTMVAPVLISHYVEDHGYKPPYEFIEAVMDSG